MDGDLVFDGPGVGREWENGRGCGSGLNKEAL